MLRTFKYLMIFLAVLLLGYFILNKLDIIPSISGIFRARPLKIEETPVLIKEINDLAELSTMVSYDEVVVDSVFADPRKVLIKTITGISFNPLSPDYKRLVLIAKGQVIAGTNLKLISPEDIVITGDSVSLLLPRAQILDIIVNPSGFETFIETGDWSQDAVTQVKQKAREKMRDRAQQAGITEKSDARSIQLMKNFLRSIGYRRIHVSTKQG